MAAARSTLRIPARAAWVGTARIFAAAVARQAGLPEERIEDLKLVISEACAVGVRENGEGAIVVSAEVDGPAVAFEIAGEDLPPPPSEEAESFDRNIGYDVILSLFPDASFQETAVRFTARKES